MSGTANPTSADAWRNDRGAAWLRSLDGYEAMLHPLGEALLEAAGLIPGESVADIGCGGGATSRAAASRVAPTGQVTGIDIAPMLVEEAARRAQAHDNLRFLCADASQGLAGDERFDCLISRLGVMFFTDPAKAFAALHGLLKPEGRIALAVWAPSADNPWMSGVRPIVERHVALAPLDPQAPGPFSLADQAHAGALLAQAGFADIAFADWRGAMAPGGATTAEAAADFALTAFSFGAPFDQADRATRERVREDLADFYRGFVTSGALAVPARAWLVTARATSR